MAHSRQASPRRQLPLTTSGDSASKTSPGHQNGKNSWRGDFEGTVCPRVVLLKWVSLFLWTQFEVLSVPFCPPPALTVTAEGPLWRGQLPREELGTLRGFVWSPKSKAGPHQAGHVCQKASRSLYIAAGKTQETRPPHQKAFPEHEKTCNNVSGCCWELPKSHLEGPFLCFLPRAVSSALPA